MKITSPPSGPTRTAAKGVRRALLSHWNGRNALTITVKYRGGPECWYEVRARGRIYRAPGVLALHDVMQTIYEGH